MKSFVIRFFRCFTFAIAIAVALGLKVTTASADAPCVPAPSGLVSWWQAESNALDSADGNNGTLQNGATFASGKVGRAFSLDGVNDFVSVADAPNLRFGPSSPMTVDLWVYRTSSNPALHLIGKRAGCSGSPTAGTYQMFLDMNTGAGLGFGNPGGACACSGQDLPLSTWTHLAGTFDGTTLRLFINGQLVVATPGSLGPANTLPLLLGGSGACGTFGGLIDEVSLYNQALSTNEIQAIYNAGSAGKCGLPATILAQPQDRTVPAGDNATFTVSAGGTPPLSYQWRFGVANIIGATNASLTVSNAQPGDVGNYSVVVSNAYGTATSSNALLTVTSTSVCVPAPSGLVSWWRAESNALDSVDGNHGSLVGNVTYAAGRVGRAFSLDGANSYVSIPSSSNVNFSGHMPMTIETWVYRTGGGAITHIVGKRNGCTSGGIQYQLATDDANGVLFSSNGVLVGTHQPLLLNTWQHLAATYDGTTVVLYVNGQPVASGSGSLGAASTSLLKIGAAGSCAGFAGLIDEVSLYNRALSTNEIQAIFNAGSAGKCPPPPPAPPCVSSPSGLVSWWQAESNALDSVDGNHGSLVGNVTYAAGRVGRAFSLDGANSYVSIPSSSNVNFSGHMPMTIETWVYRTGSASIMHIVGKRNGCYLGEIQYQLAFDDANGLLFYSDGVSVITHRPLPLNTWQHLAATYDGTTAVFYIDGQPVASGSGSLGAASTAPLEIGNAGSCGADYGAAFAGLIDEVSLYNRALTTNEIQAIFSAGSTGKCGLPSVILTSPQNRTVAVGENASFTVSASGSPPLNYQWRFGAANINGATNSSLTVSNVQPGNAGNYSVVVSNAYGPTATSSNGLLTVTAPPICVTAPSGLVSWWQAESNALDSVDGNHGSLVGNVTYAAGRVGRAFSLDGANSYVSIPSSSNVNFSGHMPMTIETWVYRTGSASIMHIVGKRNGCYLGEIQYQLAFDDANGLLFYSDGVSVITHRPLPLNTWQHLAATYDGTTAVFYIDGQPVASGSGSLGAASTAPLEIGNAGSCGADYGAAFAGLIDEVSLYNRALTTNEIQAIFSAGSTGKCPPPPPPPLCVSSPSGLVSWWQAESNALDSADGNNGTLQNGATFASGKVGRAFSLDGVNDFVSVADAPNLRFGTTSPMTVDLWVYRTSSNPDQSMIGKRAGCSGSSTEGTFHLFLDMNTGAGLGFGNPGGSCACSGQDLPLNTWTHLAGTFDGTTLRLFINGQLVATTLGSLGPANTAPLLLGGSGACGTFGGLIDEVALYNRALATNEIQAIYNAGSAGKCGLPPTILTQPQDRTVPAGDNVTFTVLAGGSPPLSYQWRFGVANINGATNSSLTVSNAQPGDAGNYSVVVSNGYGTPATSSNALLTVTSSSVCVPAPSGLVSWWQAESNALDSADGNSGTLQNGATFASGKVGRAFSLDGVNDFVSVADAPNLRFGPTVPMTLDLWVYRTSSNPDQSMIGKRAGCSGSSTEGTFHLFLDMNTGAGLGFGNPGGSCACSGQDLPLNTWTHLAGTFDGTTLRLFINGQLVATTPGSLGPANTAPLLLGGSGACGTFGGLIDEVSLYNRALATNEIQAIYNAGSAGKCGLPPTILAQPQDRTVAVGENASFTVSAGGSPPLSYQWRFGVANINGATNASLTVSNAQPGDAGNYSVVVSNAYGTATSSNALLTVTASPVCVPAPSGLVSWWQAESNALDGVDGNNGTLQNGAAFAAGRVGRAFSLDGVNDFVSVADAPNLRFGPTVPMTVDLWVYRTSSNPVQHMIGKRAGCSGSSTEGTFHLFLDMNTGAGLGFGNPGGSCACSGQDLPLNTWTHLAGTFDGTTLRLFINGQLAATTPGSLGPANTVPLKIGDAGSCGADYGAGFAGLIDEVSLYNRALATNEIQAIYNAGSAGKCLIPPPVNHPPVAKCKDVTVPADTNWQATASIDDGSFDPDTGDTITLTQTPAGPYALGTNSVTLTVTDSHGASNSCTATVTVLGARRAKEDVLTELIALRATVTNQHDGQKLDEAIEHLTKSLAAELWVDQTHLERKHGDKVFQEEKETVKKLCDLIKSKQSNIPDAVLQDFIDRIFRADRLLASVAIQEAIAAGVSPKKIEQAQKHLAKGDADAGDEKCDNGIEDYGNAWKHAVRAKISSPVHLANGHTQLEVLGAPGERLTIQASSNLVDWVTIGSARANADGVVTFDDATAGQHPVRYYRAISE